MPKLTVVVASFGRFSVFFLFRRTEFHFCVPNNVLKVVHLENFRYVRDSNSSLTEPIAIILVQLPFSHIQFFPNICSSIATYHSSEATYHERKKIEWKRVH